MNTNTKQLETKLTKLQQQLAALNWRLQRLASCSKKSHLVSIVCEILDTEAKIEQTKKDLDIFYITSHYPERYIRWIESGPLNWNRHENIRNVYERFYPIWKQELIDKSKNLVIGDDFRSKITLRLHTAIMPIFWVEEYPMSTTTQLDWILDKVKASCYEIASEIEKEFQYKYVSSANRGAPNSYAGYAIGTAETMIEVDKTQKKPLLSIKLFNGVAGTAFNHFGVKKEAEIKCIACLYAFAGSDHGYNRYMGAWAKEGKSITNYTFDFNNRDDIACWDIVNRYQIINVAAKIILGQINTYDQLQQLINKYLYPRFGK